MAKIPVDFDMLPASDDRIFKLFMTHPDAKPVLMSVISACIERRVLGAVVRNNEAPVMDTDEKNERFDVNCEIDGGDQVDAEMSGSRLEEIEEGHKNFHNKSIYYLTDLHSSQKSKGVKYADFVRTYQVTFVDYTVYPDYPEYVNRLAMRRPNGEQVSDQINRVVIELTKLKHLLKKPLCELSDLDMWSLFMKYAHNPKHRDLINKIIDKKEEIGMAAALVMEVSKDDQERARFRSRRMFETDMTSNFLTAEARGIAIGEARGEAKLERRVLEIARNLKDTGIPIESVAAATGLSVREIEKL
jgi:predicted transposase/invertase (TIGR01784 family)